MRSLTRPLSTTCRRALTSLTSVLAFGLCTQSGSRVDAATATASQTVSATIGQAFSLSIGDPTAPATGASGASSASSAQTLTVSVPGVEIAPIGVTVIARTGSQGRVVLTVQALDDLRSGKDVIECEKVTWITTGSGFRGGTLSKTEPQMVGAWMGPVIQSGTINCALAKRGDYAPGSYTTTLVFTLFAP
jgi:hypothetical protein